jgi:hypothetical protein
MPGPFLSFAPLCSGVRGIEILRTSHKRNSRKFVVAISETRHVAEPNIS